MSRYNSLFNQLQKHLTKFIRKKSTFSKELSSSEKFDFSLSKNFENDFLQNKFKAKHHPGVMKIPVVKLPETLCKTILAIKEEKGYHDKILKEAAHDLSTYIYMRQPPLEQGEVQQVVEMITAKLASKGKLPESSKGAIESVEDMSKEEKKRFQTSLRQHIYNWHPIKFDEFKSFTYLWARMVPDYAALIRIFSEIQKRQPNFKPLFLFDFGSGVGSAMWATEHIWPNSVREVYNVDASGDMNDLSEQLFKSGIENNLFLSHQKSTYFRQYLPTSEGLKYDLVVSSRSLFEVGDLNNRVRTIDILWKKVAPGGFLVVVEAGTMSGYTIMMEIRDYLQEISRVEREKYNYRSPIHVFSPCPHDYSCPRFFHRSSKPCHFSVACQSISSFHLSVDKFSYLVFRKEDRCEQNEEAWPRIVQPVLRKHNHIITRTCTPAGAIRELVVTKSKHGDNCYHICRKCKWGDLLPVDIHKDSIDNSDKDVEYNDAIETLDENYEVCDIETGTKNSIIVEKET